MRRLNITALFLMTLVMGGNYAPLLAQESFSQLDEEQPDVDLRFQFMAHNFTVDGVEQEIFLKLDCFTGRVWRFSATNPKWVATPENNGTRPRGTSNMSRYELLAHNYVDKDGQDQEVIIRADSMSGYTWAYHGANGSWSDIAQED